MALDVYFRDDILNILRSTYAASEGTSSLVMQLLQDPDLEHVPVQKMLAIYRRGFITALGSVGLAFGLDTIEQENQLPAGRSLVLSSEPVLLSQPLSDRENAAQDEQSLSDLDMFRFLWTRAQREHEPR
jgi:hypothetical protein